MNGKSADEKNRQLWTELYQDSRHHTRYPKEEVVQFVCRNFARDGSCRILDLGCGAGRHVIFMAQENIIPYGLDFSPSGVAHTRNWLEKIGRGGKYLENIQVGNATDIPYKDEMFDGLICIGVLYYMAAEDIKKAVSEIYRVLRSGGKSLILMRSTDDYRCKSSDAVPTKERNTFIVGERDTTRSANCENGMLMHFVERTELEELFQDFQSVTIDRITITHDNESYADDDFLITCVK